MPISKCPAIATFADYSEWRFRSAFPLSVLSLFTLFYADICYYRIPHCLPTSPKSHFHFKGPPMIQVFPFYFPPQLFLIHRTIYRKIHNNALTLNLEKLRYRRNHLPISTIMRTTHLVTGPENPSHTWRITDLSKLRMRQFRQRRGELGQDESELPDSVIENFAGPYKGNRRITQYTLPRFTEIFRNRQIC